MFRAEYLHSQGWGSNLNFGDKADGWYVFGIVPVIKGKLQAKARYQCYRQDKSWNSKTIVADDGASYTYGGAKTSYEVGLNYFFTKNLEMHLEYARINDRSLAKHDYNLVDLEMDFRF
jgi:phosphate-selective porin